MQSRKLKFFLGSVLCVAFGLILFVVAVTNIPNKFVAQSNDWIGFYGAMFGSLLGGYITFLGVQLSLDHTESIRTMNDEAEQERKRLEILPHITAHFRLIDVVYNKDLDCCDYEIALKLRNIGKDNCINIVVTIYHESSIASESTKLHLFFKNSIVKNEYTNEEFIFVNKIDSNFKSIEVDFMDLELRQYSQIIDVDFSFYDSIDVDKAELRSIVQSKIPKFCGQ